MAEAQAQVERRHKRGYRLTLTYTHTSTADVRCQPESRYAATYEGMMDRCYWDYVRILVPEGAELVDATRIPVPGDMMWGGRDYSGEVVVDSVQGAPYLTWGVLGVIAPGDTQTRDFTWSLPADVVEWDGREGRYVLNVQKQPGKEGHPLTVRVRLPKDSELLESRPAPTCSGQAWVAYRTIIDRDLTFDVE